MAVARGEIWMADLSPTRGTEQSGVRPVPSHVFVPLPEGGLSQDSVLLSEQIRVIDQLRLIRKLGDLPAARMQEVDQTLRVILEL